MEPAIVAVLGAILGILLSNGIKLALDARSRTEKVRDIQTALRAEIRSHRRSLDVFLDETAQRAILDRIRAEDGYSPFINRELDPFVFDAIVGEIHVLPSAVIDPIVLYYRQWRILAILADDMRSAAFAALSQPRKEAIYSDYGILGLGAVHLAKDAIDALNMSLEKGTKP